MPPVQFKVQFKVHQVNSHFLPFFQSYYMWCPFMFFIASVSSLPASVQPGLDEVLDWDRKGVDKDLMEIAHHMLCWEEQLSALLGLTQVDIHDIKQMHTNKPKLQRWDPKLIIVPLLHSAAVCTGLRPWGNGRASEGWEPPTGTCWRCLMRLVMHTVPRLSVRYSWTDNDPKLLTPSDARLHTLPAPHHTLSTPVPCRWRSILPWRWVYYGEA